MNLKDFFADKQLKPKQKTETLSKYLLEKNIELNVVIDFAEKSKDAIKATCIEAVEYATKINPSIINKNCFDFVANNLLAKAPRIKWESAKVIGNTAHLFANNLEETIANLLENSKHDGTVVRWSAAYAITQIALLKTKQQQQLIEKIKEIADKEEKPSIKKIYLQVLKKLK